MSNNSLPIIANNYDGSNQRIIDVNNFVAMSSHAWSLTGDITNEKNRIFRLNIWINGNYQCN